MDLVSLIVSSASLAVSCLVLALLLRIQGRGDIFRLTNLGNVVSDQVPSASDEQIITLSDNEGSMKLSVRLKNIYYIESDDNYIKVWYEDHAGSMKQYMLRCRLKTVEESFTGSDLVRCHRQYIVNMSKVQVLHKEKDGYYLDLGEGAGDVPVSKTYEPAVLARFNSR